MGYTHRRVVGALSQDNSPPEANGDDNRSEKSVDINQVANNNNEEEDAAEGGAQEENQAVEPYMSISSIKRRIKESMGKFMYRNPKAEEPKEHRVDEDADEEAQVEQPA